MPFSVASNHLPCGYFPVITQPNSSLSVPVLKRLRMILVVRYGVNGSREGAAAMVPVIDEARMTTEYSQAFCVSVSSSWEETFMVGHSMVCYMFTENTPAVPNMAQGHIMLVHKKLERGSAVKLWTEHITLLSQEVSTYIIYSINTRHLLYKNRSLWEIWKSTNKLKWNTWA